MGCCDNKSIQKKREQCPSCQSVSLAVSMRTLLHHVKFPENQSLPNEHYFYCANEGCEVVYFSDNHNIARDLLREPIQHMLCYCFDISKPTYRAALNDNQAEIIKNFVVQQTQAGLCACEARNLSGRCCLAGFKKMEKVMQAESTITCPNCGYAKKETMPTDACQWFYECTSCHEVLKPKQGDCCVFCSYGDVPCPPIQLKS